MKIQLLSYTFKMVAVLVTFLTFIVIFSLSSQSVSAQVKSFVYDEIDVDITLNTDSTMDVSEQITYRFNGEFHGVFREITLEDRDDIDLCKSNPSLQCGGFEFLIVEDALDGEGNSLEGQYKQFEVDDSYERRHRVEWEFSPSGTNFDDETFTWTINYKVYGSLGYFDDYDLFYWNALFSDRAEVVENFNLDVHFPSDINFDEDNLKVFGSDFDYFSSYSLNTLNLTSENVPVFSNYTVLLKFPKNIISEYGGLDLELNPDTQDVTIKGTKLEGVTKTLYGLPSGRNELVFSSDGYLSKDIDVSLKPGEILEMEVKLEPTPLTRTIQIVVLTLNVLACLFLFVFIFFMYAWWVRKGRDRGGRKTIVPWFEPPDGIPPYLLGSVKDEKVDLVDLTSTIIDLAYRGFINIKELGKRKTTGYELIKKKEFDSPKLTEVEREFLVAMFDDKKSIKTSDLKYKFYEDVKSIKDMIYDEMVEREYFDRRPDKVRVTYLIIGIVMTVLGFFLISPLMLAGLIFPPIVLTLSGIIVLIVSFFMPAKTPKGTEIFEQAKGFKMYLHTAERFRLQKLTPKTFEKYLSYAIVFGIEKEWAKKFKDIYKEMPDWYQTRPGTVFNTFYLTRALSRFNTVTASTLVSRPSSGGSFGSDGWSGGGGFSGGFSGGGGGGGGGGAW